MDYVSNFIQLLTEYLINCGPLLGILIIIIESFFPPLPLGVFIALNCNAYGIIFGIILSWISTVFGCTLSYLFFKKLSNKVIYKYLSEKTKERVKRSSLKFNKLSLSSLVLIIALPFTPAFLVNIIAGVSNLPRKKFITALLIGKMSIVGFWGIIGKSFIESMHDIKAIIFILLALLIAYIISKIVSKKAHIE